MNGNFNICLAAAFLAVSPVYAQTDQNEEIEEITVIGSVSNFGATKSEIPVNETPRSLSVITSEEFIERGFLTLDDTFAYTAGVIGDQFGFATRGDNTTIRGLPAPQYLDNLQSNFSFFNTARTDIYTLEQVEVLKGPASVLYGQAQPGGAVSTVSKKAGRDALDKELSFTAGTFNLLRLETDLGFDLSGDGRWTGRLVGVLQDSDTQINEVNDDTFVFAPSITYSNETTTITALINITEDDGDTAAQFLPLTGTACASSDVQVTGTSLCDAATGQAVDNDLFVGIPGFNSFETSSESITIFGSYLINNIFSIDGVFRLRENEGDYQQTWISFAGDGNPRITPEGAPTLGRSFFDQQAGTDQIALDFRFRSNFNIGPISNEVIVGVNYQEIELFDDSAFLFGVQPTSFNVFDPAPDISEVPTQAEFDAARFLIENETEAIDLYLTSQSVIGDIVVNAGIRVSSVESSDAFSQQDDDETPFNIGVLYNSGIGLNPYINFSESFLATVGTDVNLGTPLLPQTGQQFEIGVKYEHPGSDSFFTVSFFDLEQDNLQEFVAAGTVQLGDSAEVTGAEFEGRIQLGDFTGDLNATFLDADNIDSTGVVTTFDSLPDTTISAWIAYQPESGTFQNFNFGSGVRFASENEDNNGDIVVITDGSTVFDASVRYTGFDRLDLSLNLRNLTNEEFFTTCLTRGDCFVGEERTITANIAIDF